MFRNRELIENVIEKSGILVENPRFDSFACRVLVTELLLGRANGLKGEAMPIVTVLKYKDKLLEHFKEAQTTITLKEKGNNLQNFNCLFFMFFRNINGTQKE